MVWERLKEHHSPLLVQEAHLRTDLTIYHNLQLHHLSQFRRSPRFPPWPRVSISSSSTNSPPCIPTPGTKASAPHSPIALGRALFIGTPTRPQSFLRTLQYARQGQRSRSGPPSNSPPPKAASSHRTKSAPPRLDLDLHIVPTGVRGPVRRHRPPESSITPSTATSTCGPLKFDNPCVLSSGLSISMSIPCACCSSSAWTTASSTSSKKSFSATPIPKKPAASVLRSLRAETQINSRLSASLNLQIYGDASGNQDRTSASATDWKIIRQFFAHYKGQIEHSIHVQ